MDGVRKIAFELKIAFNFFHEIFCIFRKDFFKLENMHAYYSNKHATIIGKLHKRIRLKRKQALAVYMYNKKI